MYLEMGKLLLEAGVVSPFGFLLNRSSAAWESLSSWAHSSFNNRLTPHEQDQELSPRRVRRPAIAR